MKHYDAIILNKDDQIRIFGKCLEFNHDGFVDEPRLDWWGILEEHFNKPVVSVKRFGAESWNEIIVLMAEGHVYKGNRHVLYYGSAEKIESVLRDIFTEAENDEYEVFENYTAVCSKEEWDRVVKWIHETY